MDAIKPEKDVLACLTFIFIQNLILSFYSLQLQLFLTLKDKPKTSLTTPQPGTAKILQKSCCSIIVKKIVMNKPLR
jgi:hypothetical protein